MRAPGVFSKRCVFACQILTVQFSEGDLGCVSFECLDPAVAVVVASRNRVERSAMKRVEYITWPVPKPETRRLRTTNIINII